MGIDPSGLNFTLQGFMATSTISTLIATSFLSILGGIGVYGATGDAGLGVWTTYAFMKIGVAISLIVAMKGKGLIIGMLNGLASLGFEARKYINVFTTGPNLIEKSLDIRDKLNLVNAFANGMLLGVATFGAINTPYTLQGIGKLIYFLPYCWTPKVLANVAVLLHIFGIPVITATSLEIMNETMDHLTGEGGGFESGKILITLFAAVFFGVIGRNINLANNPKALAFSLNIFRDLFQQLYYQDYRKPE
jgi:hypothetical protein